ncbi:MAG: antitoxin VbhA family protein [Clostridia bacterium]|nr:antitoxin VbhA family protein [Clostridia bacterium]
MSKSTIRKAMANAEASIKMEGLVVSDKSKELCRKIMDNEITFEEYLKAIITGEACK